MGPFDKRRLLLDDAHAGAFARQRRALAAMAAAAGVAAAPELAGCDDDDDNELGAFGGVEDIPGGLEEMQQWSGSVVGTTPIPGGRPLIRVQLPLLYARDWTVQLATPIVPGTNPVGVGVASTQSARVQLRWGHHGAADQVDLDWPSRGASVTVHGAFVEVTVFDPGTGAPAALTANYTAWLSEGSGSRSDIQAFQPMRTVAYGSIANAALGGPFAAPPRARGFYITAQANAAAVAPFEVVLADNGVERMRYQVEPRQAGANQPRLGTQLQEVFFFPPSCNVLAINNTTGFALDDVRVVYLLDIGS